MNKQIVLLAISCFLAQGAIDKVGVIKKLESVNQRILVRGVMPFLAGKLQVEDESTSAGLAKGEEAKECVQQLGKTFLQKLKSNSFIVLSKPFLKCREMLQKVEGDISDEELKKINDLLVDNGPLYQEMDQIFTKLENEDNLDIIKFQSNAKNC